jgi:predicted DNA-binding helix-hairpin-helix protein
MEPLDKLQLFATQMHLEPAEETGPRLAFSPPDLSRVSGPRTVLPCGQVSDRPSQVGGGLPSTRESLGITYAAMPGGRQIALLKTMMTSACERNCYYCPFRAGRNYRRETFSPQEMATTFMKMHRAGLVEGLFLSSGIIRGGVTTQDKIIDTAEILRHKLGFRGYIHLKIMPGSDRDQVQRTMQLANRVSANLEGANTERLALLAPKKAFLEELVQPLKWTAEIRGSQPASLAWNGRWASSATQFVVGAAGESDLELLSTTAQLYGQLDLRRAYFSLFNPISDTPLENHPPEDPWRMHRLYQASYLLRDYRFDLEEMPFDSQGNLPLGVDPKLAWAKAHLAEEPVELNRAGRETLLRVPGIGLKGANTIMTARRHGKLRELSDLKQLGLNPTRPAPFILMDGKRPAYQLPLL